MNPEAAQKYHIVLSNQKFQKIKNFQSGNLNDSYVPDAYDQLLTQGEIQEHLNKVNLLIALEMVEEAVQLQVGLSSRKILIGKEMGIGFKLR